MFCTCRTMDELQALVDRMSIVLVELRLAELRLAPPPLPQPVEPLPPPPVEPLPPPPVEPLPQPAGGPLPRRDHWSPAPKSNYRGVTWYEPKNMWRAQLSKDTRGPRKYVGYYVDEVEAAHAFDVAGAERGYLAKSLNFPSK